MLLMKRPECTKCKRPVEWFQATIDHLRETVTYTARCHGAVQKVEISDHELHNAAGIFIGGAFAEPERLMQKPQ